MKKKRSKSTNARLLTSVLASMVALSALSQAGRASLVVEIVVDQLRGDYIEQLQSQFSARGFNRLMSEGVYFDNVEMRCADVDIASGTAVLMTGAYARENGIPKSLVFNSATQKPERVLTDAKSIGNYTDETLSPSAIKVSTLADEVRVHNSGLGRVYSIAPDAQQAIIMAGHAANSAFWISDVTGKWATTTYYKEVPQCISTRNYKEPLQVKLDSLVWEPMLALDRYQDVPETAKFYKFRYMYPASRTDRYTAFKNSGKVNEEVTSVAIDYLNTLQLGKRGQLDMLNVGYTAAPYLYTKDSDGRLEMQDIYVRLDSQIGRLLDEVDSAVGLQNAVVVVTSTGHYKDNVVIDERFNIPTGEFFPDRALSLLNMYLMAVYGNGQWVNGYYEQQFFLNRNLIKDRGLDLAEIRAKSSEFLRQMSGVKDAYTFEEILNNPVDETLQKMHRTLIADRYGDVAIVVAPGWEIVENINGGKQKRTQVRSNAITTPAMILAPGVKPQRFTSVVDAAMLAPTVSRLLRIRSPNAAESAPMILK